MTKADILGVEIDSITHAHALEKIELFFDLTYIENKKLSNQIITANPEIILKAASNLEYKNLINNSSLVVPDGIGLLWAAKFLSLKSNNLSISIIQALYCLISLIFQPEYCREVLPERIAGVDLMEKICEKASQKNWKVYLLGGERGIAKNTAEILKNKYLNLNIAGAESGGEFPNQNFQEIENFHKIISKIQIANPDILFVACGAPKQDFFIQQILPELPSVKLAMGVGGAFDFISGKVKRAPLIFQDMGIEWLWRLFNQPWRLMRIFKATVFFAYKVIKYKHLIN